MSTKVWIADMTLDSKVNFNLSIWQIDVSGLFLGHCLRCVNDIEGHHNM